MTRPIRPAGPQRRILWRKVATDVPKPASLDHTAVAAGLWVRWGTWSSHLVLVHASGHWNAPAADVAKYLAALIRAFKPDIVTATEAQQHGVLAAVQAAVGPRYVVEKTGEYLCIRKVATVTSSGVPELVHLTHTPGLHQDWRNLTIGAFPLQLVGGCDLMVTVGHCPSGVEAGGRYNLARRLLVLTSRSGFKAWGRWMDARPATELQVAAMDSNLNHHRRAWRWLLHRWLHAGSIWTRKRPRVGSHAGRRLIDVIYLRRGKTLTPKETR